MQSRLIDRGSALHFAGKMSPSLIRERLRFDQMKCFEKLAKISKTMQ
jgi:hypothetical protein